jgi:hypothetical protein
LRAAPSGGLVRKPDPQEERSLAQKRQDAKEEKIKSFTQRRERRRVSRKDAKKEKAQRGKKKRSKAFYFVFFILKKTDRMAKKKSIF